MRTDFSKARRGFARQGMVAAAIMMLVACGAPARTGPILATAPSGGMIAVSTQGTHELRFLYVRGGSIVLMRSIFLPDDARIVSVEWSADGRTATIQTTAGRVAIDTRSWRLAPRTGMAEAHADDTLADGGR